ncbi:hypothetical protein ADU59_23720 [Pararhizobium polonicum]|uniref:DUF3426 domain-containing protein n=1 Tax=Pararhizobium polonicum TaxID=1612624 RepID=A0A1C7NVS4_9HYPH|nr:hypothetical protein [Pararhizobium polonicum]OBZ93093.1 hypothetical protein ADU59_23720 [Pararhizobium polonicum]
MIWIFPALAGLLIVYFAMRSSRFRRFAEPVLSVLVALGLLSAFVIWLRDGGSQDAADTQPPLTQSRPVIQPEEIVLDGLQFTRNRPDTSYRVTGTVLNNSPANLTNFNLTVTLEDCPDNACKTIGEDTALILARVPAGASQTFETFFTFPNRFGIEPTAPKWSTRVSNVQGIAAP